jgi:hypothetical protein
MTMMKVSTARKMGIVTRVAGRQIQKTRTFNAVWGAARGTAKHFGRVLGQLWLEVTGFVFLALAGIGALSFVREYTKYHNGQITSSRATLAACFTGLFCWFGVSSFWRVRKRVKN